MTRSISRTDFSKFPRRAVMLALIAGMLPGVARAQSCDALLTNQMNFLRPASSYKWVKIFVTSNHVSSTTPQKPWNATTVNVVTYAEMYLRAGTGWSWNMLLSDGGEQYYSNKVWQTSDPFSGSDTKIMTFSANTANGTVSISSSDGTSHSFTPTCNGSMMHGSVSGSGGWRTDYLISFQSGTITST
jgi:hypothetical protein